MGMTPERYQELTDLFAKARELPEAERNAMLIEACGDDAEMRSSVAAMLKHARLADEIGFLANEAPPTQSATGDTDGGGEDASATHGQQDESERKIPIEPAVGGKLGKFTILRCLGAGAMGVVYLAQQESPRRKVAIKILTAGLIHSRSCVERFRQEADSAAALDHPSIVPVFESGQADGWHYYSMQYVEGETLAERLARGPLSSAQAVELVQRLAEAVDYAHGRGIVHRDLKPANVLWGADGRPRIADFGLAKRLEENSNLTATGQVLGTPSFMAPEQASGDSRRVGPAADVYALGGLLYAALTGRPPFVGDSVHAVLRQVETAEPVSPRLLNASVDSDLETIVLKCLEKNPSHRYATAAELASDLERHQAGEPVAAAQLNALAWVSRWSSRNVAVLGLAVALLVVTASALAAHYLAWSSGSLSHERYTLVVQSLSVEKDYERDVKLRDTLPEIDGPDLFVRLKSSAGFEYQTRTSLSSLLSAPPDAYAPIFDERTIHVQVNDRISISVWDEDGTSPYKPDDLLAEKELLITSDVLKKGSVELKFGVVKKLTLRFDPPDKHL